MNNYFRNQWWRRKTGLVNFLFQSDSHQASSGEFVHWQDKGGRQKPNILCSSQNIYNLVSPDPAHMWLDNIVRMNELMRVENNSWSWHLEKIIASTCSSLWGQHEQEFVAKSVRTSAFDLCSFSKPFLSRIKAFEKYCGLLMSLFSDVWFGKLSEWK